MEDPGEFGEQVRRLAGEAAEMAAARGHPTFPPQPRQFGQPMAGGSCPRRHCPAEEDRLGILDQGECVQRPSELMAEEVRKFESAYRPIHLAEPWTRALAEGTRYVPVAIDGGIELGRQTTGLPGDMETAITERLANLPPPCGAYL